jgi:hypothetical protein
MIGLVNVAFWFQRRYFKIGAYEKVAEPSKAVGG